VLRNFGGEVCGGVLPDLFRVSCNTGFAQIGLDLGGPTLAAEANAFGFDKTPPLDLPAVAQSFFPASDSFTHDQPGLAKSAIGQENVAATPLEMALVASALANNGVIMRPHILSQVTNSEGQVVRTYKPSPWIRATSPETAAQMTQLMTSVVQNGTGTAAQIPGVQVAGKTGTAQTGNNTIHAWFACFAPAAQPKIAVAVLVENQPESNEATGGAIAAPIAKAVLQAALGG
jgi:peptidoglycan glycosyltransferase